MIAIVAGKTPKVIADTPIIKAYTVSCVDLLCTSSIDWDNNRETKFEEINAPRRPENKVFFW